MAEVKSLSRSEHEAQIKDKAGWVITVLAVNDRLFKASLVVGILGAILMSQGVWLWLPF